VFKKKRYAPKWLTWALLVLAIFFLFVVPSWQGPVVLSYSALLGLLCAALALRLSIDQKRRSRAAASDDNPAPTSRLDRATTGTGWVLLTIGIGAIGMFVWIFIMVITSLMK